MATGSSSRTIIVANAHRLERSEKKVGQKITFHIRFLLWKLSLVVFVARF